ncbi:hypothetical protein [Streptomyces sp. enrichment culture]|uniref:hypothetical protein n=1 Tax=Streptomyces sp. enrichment culture TaxID=1795815 RepID=UPI003F5665ED
MISADLLPIFPMTFGAMVPPTTVPQEPRTGAPSGGSPADVHLRVLSTDLECVMPSCGGWHPLRRHAVKVSNGAVVMRALPIGLGNKESPAL